MTLPERPRGMNEWLTATESRERRTLTEERLIQVIRYAKELEALIKVLK